MQFPQSLGRSQLPLFHDAILANPVVPMLTDVVEDPLPEEPEAFSELSLRGATGHATQTRPLDGVVHQFQRGVAGDDEPIGSNAQHLAEESARLRQSFETAVVATIGPIARKNVTRADHVEQAVREVELLWRGLPSSEIEADRLRAKRLEALVRPRAVLAKIGGRQRLQVGHRSPLRGTTYVLTSTTGTACGGRGTRPILAL